MSLDNTSLADCPNEKLLTPEQAAVILGVKVGTLAIWRTSGRYSLQYRKVGRLVRYQAGDLRQFIESQSRLHTHSEVV